MVDSSKPLSIEEVVKQTLAKMKQPAATQEPEKKEVEAKPEVKPAEKIIEVPKELVKEESKKEAKQEKKE